MDPAERFARIEQRLEHLIELIERSFVEQEKKNEEFKGIRDRFIIMEASAKGAWWMVGIFGSLTVGVSGLVAWVVTQFK